MKRADVIIGIGATGPGLVSITSKPWGIGVKYQAKP